MTHSPIPEPANEATVRYAEAIKRIDALAEAAAQEAAEAEATLSKIDVLEAALLRLQKPVRDTDGKIIGYDPGTPGIEEISGDHKTVTVTFRDGEEWHFKRVTSG